MADRYTPKSKIAKLKRELEELDQKMQECTTDRPTYAARGMTERGDKRRVSLFSGRQGDGLKEEGREAVKKQRDLASFQSHRQSLLSQLSSETSSLALLQSQFQTSKHLLNSSLSKLETQSRITQAKRKRNLQSYDKQTSSLTQKKSTLCTEITSHKDKLRTAEEGKGMCCEELWEWGRLHEEYVAEREEAEVMLADFQREHEHRDVSLLIQALFTADHKAGSDHKKLSLSSQLAQTDQHLSTATKDCFLLSSQRQTLLSQLTNLIDPRINDNIRVLEGKLGGDWEKLEEIVVEMNAEAGFDVDEEVLRVQVEVMEQKVAALEKEYMLDCTDLEERILELQDEPNPSPAHIAKVTRLHQQATDLKRTQMSRLAAISQWQSEALSLLQGKTASNLPIITDDFILNEAKTRLKRGGKRLIPLEKLISDYIQALQSKEAYLQTSEYHNLRLKLRATEGDLREKTGWKTALQLERGRARAELKAIEAKEKESVALGGVDITHPLFDTAKVLVARVTYWESLAGKATARLKALLSEYRAWESRVKGEKGRVDVLLRDVDSCQIQLQEAQKLILEAGEPQTNDEEEAEIAKMKAALADLSSDISQATQRIQRLENDLNLLDREYQSSEPQHSNPKLLPPSSLTSSRSDLNLPQLEETGEDGPCSKETCEDTEELPSFKMETSARSSSELHGTMRSRSLLRMSVPRMPSRSPIDSREEDFPDLLDLDDDLDLLLNNQCAPPPKRPLPDNISQSDQEFFERVLPLLDSTEVYKKYSRTNSLKQKAFDPLMAEEYPADMCGFGLRMIRLSRTLKEIDVKQGLKGVVEFTIAIDQIHMPMIPQSTMAILKTQKRLIKRRSPPKPYIENLNLRYKEMKDGGFVNVNSPIFEEKCRDCSMYPFSIVLAQSGRIELIAPTYYIFKTWINGLNALIKRKSELAELSRRIPTSRRWV